MTDSSDDIRRDPATQTVVRNMAALMRARGLDPSRLARRSGLNPTGIHDILSGRSRSPTVATLGKIASGLGVSMAELLREDGDGPAPTAAAWPELLEIFEQMSAEQQGLLVLAARSWIGPGPPGDRAVRDPGMAGS